MTAPYPRNLMRDNPHYSGNLCSSNRLDTLLVSLTLSLKNYEITLNLLREILCIGELV